MAHPGETLSIYELSQDGDYAGLKLLLESRKDIDVNQYELFVYRPLPNSCKEPDELLDADDEYQSDDNSAESGTMFDYRSALFYAVVHNQLACVKLLVEHGARTDRLR
jgi:hypothetical protein